MRFAVLGLLLALAGCGGGEGPAPETDPPADACEIGAQRESLVEYMGQNYLWHEQLRAPDEAATDMSGYFSSMLHKPLDRYSYTQSSESFNQVFTEGRRKGYGYTFAWEDDARTVLRVRNVEPLGPAALAGLRRGDTIVSVDGFTPQQIATGLLPQVATEGVPRTFRVMRSDEGEVEFTAVSADFPLTPVPHAATFELERPQGGAARVGYLAYHQFVGYSQSAFSEAIRGFAEAGITELVLDLRYNGGGSVVVSQRLASLIGGERTANRLFAYLRFNPQQVARNWAFRFLAPEHPALLTEPLAGLQRLVVITSGGTASASELVIHGLRPFMPVVIIGENTYGKPYGSAPRDRCGTVYHAMQFRSMNALGESDFTSGFAPDCRVPDDLNHALGDPREGRLAAALEYIRSGSCPLQSQSFALRRAPSPQSPPLPLGETVPPGMFAD